MNNHRAFIKYGLGKSRVFRNKPFAIPFLTSVYEVDLKETVDISGGFDLGIITLDRFFLCIEANIELIFRFNEEEILKRFEAGPESRNIMKADLTEFIRTFYSCFNFEEIPSENCALIKAIEENLEKEGVSEVKIIHMKMNRIPLNDYDMENIIHFEAAKDIVTRIARVQLKDKEFIEQSRRTIAFFDIVDE